MLNKRELNYTELRSSFDVNTFNFNTTADIEPSHDIIGQERAIKALEFGLKINIRGYNIFMTGPSGTGKTAYAKDYVNKLAQGKPVPDDWCYVYNFNNVHQPTALSLPAGKGKEFENDMNEFVKSIQSDLPKAFDSEDYENQETEIYRDSQEHKTELLEQLSNDAEKLGFKVKTSDTGIYFLPIVDGKALSEEEYCELDENIKNQIHQKSEVVHAETMDIMRKIKTLEDSAEEKIKEWQNKVALFAVGVHIHKLTEKYEQFPKILTYLQDVQNDILNNLDDFIQDDPSDSPAAALLPFLVKKDSAPYEKYKVNLIIDNSHLTGAPVIVHYNPTYYNLMGKCEYENEYGTVSTDYSLIKSGLFHQANGGYLILQAEDLLNNVQSWEALKRVLKTKEITIENIKEQMGLIAMSTLKPEPIPADIKIILIGGSDLYHILYEYDEDFNKFFKIKSDFDDEMNLCNENVYKICQFISSFCRRENVPHFDKSAISKIIEYISRQVEDQRKVTTKVNNLVEILAESATWAQLEGSDIVSYNHVTKALKEKAYRSNSYDQKLLEYMEEGTIMIDTQGSVVGQINGLSVLDMSDLVFGKPSRITANTYLGKSGIVNIEREVHMSGTTHTKGVLILSAYIGEKFAQEIPMSLTASICFEQLYSGIEGDSASSTELYAILSSLSGIPINQGIAVTGSVNQKGEIQPIGGATYKIEGFFELCKSRGLTGAQGVIIPHQNVINLSLSDEVVEAVKEGKFHIYPVKTIDEGVEILTGVEAGEKQPDGSYPKGSINYLAYERLKNYAYTACKFGEESEE
jgi:lon-related putative ATP-dependent protease